MKRSNRTGIAGVIVVFLDDGVSSEELMSDATTVAQAAGGI